TRDGWRVSEVNSDVPGGFIEASGWTRLFEEKWDGTLPARDTAKIYAQALRDVAGEDGLVALVHATAYSDDYQVMRYLGRQLADSGLRSELVSPTHLRWDNGRAQLHCDFAEGWPDAIVRFFPAEWLPNVARESVWKPYFQQSSTPLSNSGVAILSQTKR